MTAHLEIESDQLGSVRALRLHFHPSGTVHCVGASRRSLARQGCPSAKEIKEIVEQQARLKLVEESGRKAE